MPQRRVAVMAHFDPGEQLAPHVRRYLAQVKIMCDEATLVSTSGVGAEGRAWAEALGVRVIERENVGYDFASYAVGLAASTVDLDTEVFITNDSFVGPTVPLQEIWQIMSESRADFWGLTRSYERVTYLDGSFSEEDREHIQSFFMVFRPVVANSAVFKRFWDEVTPQDEKAAIIDTHEIGLSQALLDDGFSLDAYFKPSVAECWLAQQRDVWWRRPDAFEGRPRTAGWGWIARHFWRRNFRLHFNPSLLLADAVFSGRLPVVKLQILREDPASLGADDFLSACERTFPTVFEGVRSYLARTEAVYAEARGENDEPTPPRPYEVPGRERGFARMRYRTP